MKVLIVSDSPNTPSGYGRVAGKIAAYLNNQADGEVHFLGLQGFGFPAYYSGTHEERLGKPFLVHPRGKDPSGADLLAYYLKKLNPQALVSLGDLQQQNALMAPITDSGWKGRWFPYTPYGTEMFVPTWACAKRAEKIIVPAQFAEKLLKGHLGADKVARIEHGVDCKAFKPLRKPDVRKARGLDGKFVVGAFGRNQLRKMWVQTVKGFAAFAKDKKDARLVLHTEELPFRDDSGQGWAFPSLLAKYGIRDKVVFTGDLTEYLNRFYIDNEMLNELYNCLDVYGFLTGGEGFGLPALEAQAAGVVPVLTDYTTGKELCGNHGLLVKPLALWENPTGIEWAVADEQEFAKHLQFLYDKPEERNKRGNQAREFAQGYDWEKVLPKWKKLIY